MNCCLKGNLLRQSAHDIRNLPDYIDNVAFAVDMDPFRGDYNIYYKTPAGVHSSYPVAASTVQRSPPGAPGFVQQVFPNSAAGLQALANANARHHDDQGRPLGIVYGFYRLHTQAIVPTSFSPDSAPRILAGIQAKDAHMRQVAGAMRDLLVNFALPIPAGRLAVAAGGRVINYLVGRGGRITASRPSSNTIQSAPGRLNNMDAMTELANTRAAQGVEEIRMSQAEYRAALQRVFPGQVDDISRMVDEIGQRAAQRAINDPRFIQAVRNGNVTQAGTLFHSAAAIETRAVPASAVPQGWTLTAEEVIQAGAGGSRTDLLFRGPAAQRVEIDWKTTGRSAMSSAARQRCNATPDRSPSTSAEPSPDRNRAVGLTTCGRSCMPAVSHGRDREPYDNSQHHAAQSLLNRKRASGPNQTLHLTAATISVYRDQRLSSRRGR